MICLFNSKTFFNVCQRVTAWSGAAGHERSTPLYYFCALCSVVSSSSIRLELKLCSGNLPPHRFIGARRGTNNQCCEHYLASNAIKMFNYMFI